MLVDMTGDDGDSYGIEVMSELAGAIPFVGPVTAPAGRRFARVLQREWSRNRSRVLELACHQAGLSREDLAERLERHPELVPLVTRVLHEAGMTGADRPLRVLAGYLGDALAEPSHAEDVAVILATLNGLAEAHIRLLEMLATPIYDHTDKWHRGSVHARSPYREEVTTSAFRKLVDLGLVDDGTLSRDLLSDSAVPTISVTQLGRDLLAVVHAVRPLDE